MERWEDVTLSRAFPEAGAVPAQFKVDPKKHPPRWLVDGELRAHQGPSRTVTSRVALRTSGGLSCPPLGEEALLTAADAKLAVAAAQRAWAGGGGEWPAMPVAGRVEAVERFAREVEKRIDEIATLVMWEIGKSWASSRDEVTRSVEYIHNTVTELERLRQEDAHVQTGEAGGKPHYAREHRRPLGKVLCVAPFNYPVNEFLTTVVPALLMGNVVLAKTPRFGMLANLALLEAFQSCFPRGVVSLIPGDGKAVIPALMSATEPDHAGNPTGVIDVLAFIGSEGAANAILKSHPVPSTLHQVLGLGAKNASVVLEGADLDAAAAGLVKGSLGFNGQRCTAEKLIFVQRSIAEPFLAKLVARVDALKVGMPWDDGVAITPLPEEKKLAWMREYLDDALSKGAKVLNQGGGEGLFSLMRPAVVYPLGRGMRLFHEEQFGPLVAVAPFDSVEDVLAWQRESPFGQQAGVWGPTPTLQPLAHKLIRYVARVNCNDVCQRGPDSFGFTATDKSGFGTLSLREALLTFSRPVLMQSPELALLDSVSPP